MDRGNRDLKQKKMTWLYVDIYYIYAFCSTLFQAPVIAGVLLMALAI